MDSNFKDTISGCYCPRTSKSKRTRLVILHHPHLKNMSWTLWWAWLGSPTFLGHLWYQALHPSCHSKCLHRRSSAERTSLGANTQRLAASSRVNGVKQSDNSNQSNLCQLMSFVSVSVMSLHRMHSPLGDIPTVAIPCNSYIFLICSTLPTLCNAKDVRGDLYDINGFQGSVHLNNLKVSLSIATYCNTSTIFYTHWQKIAKSGSTQRWWKDKTLHSAVWRQSCPEMFLLRCLVWPCRTSWVSCQQQHAEQILCTCDTANPHRRQCLHWNFLIECQMRQDNTTCMNTCSGQTQSTCNTCKLLSAWKHNGKPSINQVTRGHSPAFLQARSHVQFWQSTVLFLGTRGSGMLWHNLPEDQLHTTHWMKLLEFASAEHLGKINGSKTASLVISGNHPQLSPREKKKHCLSLLIIAQYQSSLSLMYVWQFETWNLQI